MGMKDFSFTDMKNATGVAIELIKKGLTVDEQKKVIELLEYSIDLKSDIVSLKEQIVALRDENARLNKEVKLNSQMEHDGLVYWAVDGGKRSGPFCPACWGKHKKQIHMTVEKYEYICPSCKHTAYHTSMGDDGQVPFQLL